MKLDKASSILVGCISLLWLYKGFSADLAFAVPAAIFAICAVFLYGGKKIAKWIALLLVLLNVLVNFSVANLMYERPPFAGNYLDASVELKISTFLCILSFAFLCLSIFKSKQEAA